MVTAFVLINCELGFEKEVISKLREIDSVKEIQGTFGAYDIIVKVEAESVDSLRETITWKIRRINKIRSTLTLMVVHGQGT